MVVGGVELWVSGLESSSADIVNLEYKDCIINCTHRVRKSRREVTERERREREERERMRESESNRNQQQQYSTHP